MSPRIADALRLTAYTAPADAATWQRELVEATASWGTITSWKSPVLDNPTVREDSLADAVRAGEVTDDVLWEYGDTASVQLVVGEDRMALSVHASDARRPWLARMSGLLARLMERGLPVGHGSLVRIGGGVTCLPRFKLVGHTSYLVATRPENLADAFGDAERVVRDGGWTKRDFGGVWLLTRALDAETNVEVLAAMRDGQWAMARLARAGVADYYHIDPPTEEAVPIFYVGEARVLAVGYLPDTRTAAYSCAIGEGEHIHGWEILHLRQLVRDGETPGGDPVERVSVLFPDRASAEREKRPLLDVGVIVEYYDEGGERVELGG